MERPRDWMERPRDWMEREATISCLAKKIYAKLQNYIVSYREARKGVRSKLGR